MLEIDCKSDSSSTNSSMLKISGEKMVLATTLDSSCLRKNPALLLGKIKVSLEKSHLLDFMSFNTFLIKLAMVSKSNFK